MKKYHIICERRKLNGQLEEKTIHLVNTGKWFFDEFEIHKDEFTEEEVKDEMVNLLYNSCDDNTTYIDDNFIKEEIKEGLNVSWYEGPGFYVITKMGEDEEGFTIVEEREKIDFDPLRDNVEEEHCGGKYIYYVQCIMTTDIINQLADLKNQASDVEIYHPRCVNSNMHFHTDTVKCADLSYNEAIDYIKMNNWEASDILFELMSEEEYNRTLCANCDSFDFEDIYGDKNAKVLCIILPTTKNNKEL